MAMKASHGTGRKRRHRWGRIALWVGVAVVVIAIIAVGSFYLWFRSQVGEANSRVDPGIIEALQEPISTTATTATATTATSTAATASANTTSTAAGTTSTETVTTEAMEKPTGMNIVLLGSDTRASNGSGGRSDTIIIVHVDPEKDFLSLLSIPRDLRVDVPGHGMNKINTAYTYGGPALVIRTIKSVFGLKLDHYMEIDFNAFKELTDTLGGVYVDVDRSYDDGKIVFDPGYQLLDGQNALRYCRHRHDSNYDFGRMERQQRFLNAVREQAMGWNLPFKLPGTDQGSVQQRRHGHHRQRVPQACLLGRQVGRRTNEAGQADGRDPDHQWWIVRRGDGRADEERRQRSALGASGRRGARPRQIRGPRPSWQRTFREYPSTWSTPRGEWARELSRPRG